MIKFIAIIVLVLLLFILFKNKLRKNNIKDTNIGSKKMLKCVNCATHIPANEAIKRDNKFYCSKECL